jgi:hypothetical protein
MNFWFRRGGPLFSILLPILIPFGNGKLAQEGRAFAPKRTLTNFLASGRKFRWWAHAYGTAMGTLRHDADTIEG